MAVLKRLQRWGKENINMYMQKNEPETAMHKMDINKELLTVRY